MAHAAELPRPANVLATAPTTPVMSTQIDSPAPSDVLVRSGVPELPRADVLGTELALTDYEGAMDWIDEEF